MEEARSAVNEESPNDGNDKPRIAILYHYMYPDDVVSARHLDQLASDLVAKGWDVEAFPCNRGCRDETLTYPITDCHEGVRYTRIWRPRFQQASFFGRLANSIWMIAAWTRLALRPRKRRPNVVLIGTDPIFAVAAAIPIKLFAPKIRIAHWCFDLHPEAAVAGGLISASNLITRLVRRVMRAGYKHSDVIADIGPCMRTLLQQYRHTAREVELTPWALVEPSERVVSDAMLRQELFGDATLAVLYSGNFGEAHSYGEFLAVARSLRDAPNIHFCFATRGNKAAELRQAVGPKDSNISFAGFASIEDLEKRLGAADVHMACLRPEWSGIAVPSKFFGSLAIGRPILYAGPSASAISQWIEKFGVGWVVNMDNVDRIATELRELAEAPHAIAELQDRAYSLYVAEFSRNSVTQRWHSVLSAVLKNEPF